MSKRAVRRHHYQRLKEKRVKEGYWMFGSNSGDKVPVDSLVGMSVNTPKWCSCSVCCNPRHDKWRTRLDRLTKQELKSEIEFDEQLLDFNQTLWGSEHHMDF